MTTGTRCYARLSGRGTASRISFTICGVFGPIVGVMVLQMIRTDMTFLKLDSNLATVLQGAILIGVVMIGSFVEMRRSRA